MKTVSDIDSEISSLAEEITAKEAATKKRNARLRNRVTWLRETRIYLESNPSELFLTQEIERIDKLIEALTPEFTDRHSPTYRTEQLEILGVKKLEKQRKHIKYILTNIE